MWFKKKYEICSECKVHFEPEKYVEGRFAHLCSTHRIPVMERERRKDAVMSWAASNWEKLEPQYKEDEARLMAAYGINTANLQRMAMSAQDCGVAYNALAGQSAFGNMFNRP